jgi:hypothetical protein
VPSNSDRAAASTASDGRACCRDGQPFIGGGVPRGVLAGEGDLGLGVDGADVGYR